MAATAIGMRLRGHTYTGDALTPNTTPLRGLRSASTLRYGSSRQQTFALSQTKTPYHTTALDKIHLDDCRIDRMTGIKERKMGKTIDKEHFCTLQQLFKLARNILNYVN